MRQAPYAQTEIPTISPQPRRSRAGRPAGQAKKTGAPARAKVLATGTERESTRGGGEVISLERGVTVYPARSEGGRWCAVWHEACERQQCEAATEEKLTPKLAKVAERLKADARKRGGPAPTSSPTTLIPSGSRSGTGGRAGTPTPSAGCASGSPPRSSPQSPARTSRHTQRIVNAAPTAGEGDRGHRMISALVTAGIDGGYLANPRLAKVH
jgi:hypothetical protein